MTNTAIKLYDRFGVYAGGEVTKFGTNEIRISPYLIRLYNGDLRGCGSVTNTFSKHVTIGFTNSAPTSSGYERTETEYPGFLLNINTIAAGQAWLYYSEGDEDLSVTTSISGPAANTVIFAKLVWNGSTTDISGITIDYSVRTESLMTSTSGPEDPKYFYQDGQKFTASSIGKQYANIATLTEVMQSESLLNFGDDYFVTMTKEAAGVFNGDIYGSSLTVIVKDIKHFSRVGNAYTIYHNKADSGFTVSGVSFEKTFTNVSDFQNKTIYVGIEKATGKVRIDTTWDQTIEGNYYLIAYSQIGSETVLDNAHFYVVNNLGGQALFLENFARFIRTQKTTSFLGSVTLSEIAVDNKLRIEPCILNLDGYLLFISGADITFDAPPTTGYRQDFIYLEVKKNAVPFTQLSYKLKVVSNVDYATYRDPFLNTALVKNDENNNYIYGRNGSYTANSNTNAVDGKTHGIPIAVVHRFNTGSYSGTNKNGGTGRPDGKSALRINLQEVGKKTPVDKKIESSLLLNKAIFKILEGNLNNILQPSLSDNLIFSRSPLQIDRLGANTFISDSSYIGTTDGIRTFWSRNKNKTVLLSAVIKEDLDSGTNPYNFPNIDYDTDSKTILVKVPDGTEGEITKDISTGKPENISLVWVDTLNPVKLSTDWSIGQLRNSTAIIDTSDSNYISGGKIAASFTVKYNDSVEAGLKRIPNKIISAASNNDYNTLASSFAVALSSYTNPTFIKNMTRTTTVNSIVYNDYVDLIKMGGDKKFYSYEMHYFTAGNNSNSNDYQFNDTFTQTEGIYSIVGLIDVKNALTGESLLVTKTKWTYNTDAKFLIRLSLAMPVNTPVEFVFAIGGNAGKQIDINQGSLEVANITETANLALNGSIATNLLGIYNFSNGNIFYGVSAFRNNFMVYVGEDLVPAKIQGIGTNILKATIQVTDISTYTTANWYLNSSIGKYVPNNGVTIRIPVLQSYRTDTNPIYLQYQYNSLPFTLFAPEIGSAEYNDQLAHPRLPYQLEKEKPTIVNRGFLIMSTDGSANDSSSLYAPIDQKFPVVQGIGVVGIDTPATNIGINDVFSYQQQVKPFIEGAQITLDGQLILSGIVLGGTGIVVWASLIKLLNCLKLFIYEVRDGTVVLNSPLQAFVCELEENYRELI